VRSILASAVAIGALCASAPAYAQKAPKNAVVFEGNVGPTESVEDLATLTLRRFKKNRILRVEVSLEVDGDFAGEVALLDDVLVNGHPVPFETISCADVACFVERTTFVDLDAIASSFPDDFNGQPLVVVIRGRAEWEGPPFARGLRALVQLVPK
jgi:hypothetical protein